MEAEKEDVGVQTIVGGESSTDIGPDDGLVAQDPCTIHLQESSPFTQQLSSGFAMLPTTVLELQWVFRMGADSTNPFFLDPRSCADTRCSWKSSFELKSIHSRLKTKP